MPENFATSESIKDIEKSVLSRGHAMGENEAFEEDSPCFRTRVNQVPPISIISK